jgi:uncharacterized membrane protein YsdA (DUF1294 family)
MAKNRYALQRQDKQLDMYKVGSILLAATFLFLVLALTLVGKLPKAVLWIYLVASAITFLFYTLDKSAAINNRWRIQENTLHLFELIGGWPGAMVAQRLLRHKSKKQSYQIVFWITVVLNCCVLGILITRSGKEMLQLVFDGLDKIFH